MLQNMVLGPLSRTLGLVIIFAVFSLAAGSINGWYMLAEDAWVYNDNERFDRFVTADPAARRDNVDLEWDAVTGTTALPATTIAKDTIYLTTFTSETTPCTILSTPALTIITPLGTEIDVAATATVIPNCEQSKAGDIFSAGGLSGLIKLIMQAAGLGLPIGALIGLASFGSTFVTKLGLSPLMGAIVLVIGFLLVGTLLNVLTPFVDSAFNSLDGDRFKMYDEGLGTLASVIGNFFAVVLIGGLIYVAWNVIQQFKSTGSNSNSMFGDSSRGDQM